MLTKDQLQFLDDTRMLAYAEGALWTIAKCIDDYPEGELAEKLTNLHERIKTHLNERGDAPDTEGRASDG